MALLIVGFGAEDSFANSVRLALRAVGSFGFGVVLLFTGVYSLYDSL